MTTDKSALVNEAVRLLDERGEVPQSSYEERRRLLRILMNIRPAAPLPEAYLDVQDALLALEREEKGIVRFEDAEASPGDARLALWRGDITRLGVDAIVNAANAQMLGCFAPAHGCIDNAIHSAAGLQLRQACADIMNARHEAGIGDQPTGSAEITPGFNLPARHVLHTVGPIISGALTDEGRELLASSYRSCLDLAADNGLHEVAFCCISTGAFGFPQDEAARIAVATVRDWLAGDRGSGMRVLFNVFTAVDEALYRHELGMTR